jgi:hypothetical protein
VANIRVSRRAEKVGGFRGPTLDPFNFATAPGFPNLGHENNNFGNIAYTRTITQNLVNELRGYYQRNNHLQDEVGANLPKAADLGLGTTPDNPTGPPNLFFDDSGLDVGFSENGPTTLLKKSPRISSFTRSSKRAVILDMDISMFNTLGPRNMFRGKGP